MQITGSADGVRSLSNGIVKTTREVFESTNDIKRKVQALESSFQDSGYSDVQDVVMRIYQSINSHLEDIDIVTKALNRYADLLEKK